MRSIYKFIFCNILGWSLEYRCTKDVPGSAMVIVAPHTSFYDGFIGKLGLLLVGWKHLLLSAPWLFKSPMMPIMKLIGAIPVEGARSIFKVVKTLKENDGTKIVICPEGHLAKIDNWNPGFFYMAKKANVPIIVVTLNYKTKTITFKDIIEDVSQHTPATVMKVIHNLYNDTDTYAKYPDKFILPNLSNY